MTRSSPPQGSVTNNTMPASYIIYQDSNGGVHALNCDTGATQFNTASTPATSAQTTSLFNSTFSTIAQIGGLVFVRRGAYGPYMINNIVNVGSNSFPSTDILFTAEGLDNTTIKYDAAATAANMFQLNCNALVERMTLDGNGVSNHLIFTQSPSYVTVQNNHFKNASNAGVSVTSFTPHPNGGGSKGIRVLNNWFDQTGSQDQCAIGSDDYAVVRGNFFDKRTAGINGSVNGSCITAGSASDYDVTGNIFKRAIGNVDPCISVEPYGSDYDRVVIAANTVYNGRINIGGSSWTTPNAATNFRNVVIANNALKNATIWIHGSPTDPGAGSIQNLIVEDNSVSYSYWGCIMCTNVTGPTKINGNMCRDSNQNNGTGGDRGLIYVVACNDMEISENTLHMTDNSTANTSMYGLKYDGAMTNLRIFDNVFVNPIARPTLLATTNSGANTNVQIWDNEGYLTNTKGVTTFSGNNATTAFTVTHGLAITPTIVTMVTNQNIHAYVSAISSTTFTVTFASAPATGTNNISVYWSAEKRAF